MVLTDNDRRLGPLTYGRAGWSAFGVSLERMALRWDEPVRLVFTGYLFGWTWALRLPMWLNRCVPAGEWGWLLSEGHLTIKRGVQTMDSSTDPNWSCFLPWTQWRRVRHTLYHPDGRHWSDVPHGIGGWWTLRAHRPRVTYLVRDETDGTEVRVEANIEERAWRFGTGWCKWLSLFRRNRVRRSADLSFATEVGPDRGSWKGGMIGHGIDMEPGESLDDAVRRYCSQERRARAGAYRLTYLGRAEGSDA